MRQGKKCKRLTLAEMEAFNKEGFDEAKKEFDKAHGAVFRYEEKWRYGTYRKKFSVADKTEKTIVKMLEQYESRTLSSGAFVRDGGDFSIAFLSKVFVVTDQFFGVGFILDEDEIARREEEDYWEPLVVFYELDETAQASRIRNLFQKLVTKGAALAHEIGSDTYAGWRDLLCFVEDYTPPMVHHLTENDRKECYGELEAFLQLHKRLRIDLNVFGKAEAYKSELGPWAAAWVSDYSVKAGFVALSRGKQRSFRIASSSKKAWEILTALFTSDDPEGWTKLPTGWKSQFVRKIGSSGELDRDSDIVKIAAMIVPHTPRKGRGGDGLYRFGFARPPKAK